MAQRLAAEYVTNLERREEELGLRRVSETGEYTRPAVLHSQSEPIIPRDESAESDTSSDHGPNGDDDDVVDDFGLPSFYSGSEIRRSVSLVEESAQSWPSGPKAGWASCAPSPSIYTVDSFGTHRAAHGHRQPSTIRKLKSSISLRSASKVQNHRTAVRPVDFLIPPEQPEKRFVDGIGMVLPGVCDRTQCDYPLAHFVASFRLCEPTEYTTALADHGITYTDYCRLVTALLNFLEETSTTTEPEMHNVASFASKTSAFVELGEERATETIPLVRGKGGFFDTNEQLRRHKQQAVKLNNLLEDISWNLQARGVSVMICVQSFSLFSPSRIAEAHIQILHVSHECTLEAALGTAPISGAVARIGQRLSFIDVFSFTRSEQKPARVKFDRQSVSATATMTRRKSSTISQFQQPIVRDRSKPSALWPNAIPLRKRQIMGANVDRYGIDPYFRAWMRANINSRTRCSTYAKYLVEQDNDPLANKRLEYTGATGKKNLMQALVGRGSRAWKERSPGVINRAKYEHNRRLECRKTAECGWRLRILRFGFRNPIYPPHTPEMDTLGLGIDAYESIIADIDRIHTHIRLNTKCPSSYILDSLNKARSRSTEYALTKVTEYLRQLNASQRRLVWTIEMIPGVYDRGHGKNCMEWEISAWNADDPLELLGELEKWGLIVNRLNLDDED
ncbi:hypothetical protein DDE82_005492 [Stemphylium lycopersici]|uniref:Uncharacterized protein n=1 Tax=Stemphylium lycopersici TaxID=183478 RepID=A0A364NAS4_STELY|nr:hypothetical protein TW65_03063 [Stemphylium lycopersici]RAR02937.1 hypothetical protein DDE82_005492 [Stemphylium lycopersici]RAR14444.1 hypothetical protein DDE83_002212 [Stemphylium lycopersici]